MPDSERSDWELANPAIDRARTVPTMRETWDLVDCEYTTLLPLWKFQASRKAQLAILLLRSRADS
jgi:hypothetical protein